MVSVKLSSRHLAQNLSASIDSELKKADRPTSGICHKDVIGIVILRIKKHSCVLMLMGEMTLMQTLDSLIATADFAIKHKEMEKYKNAT